jgi:hypothetical protein
VTEHLKATDHHEHHEQHDDREQLAEIGEKQADVLRARLEKAEQAHHERQAENDIAREAKNLAHTHEDVNTTDIPAERRRGPITKKQLSHGFDSQMHQARAHMTPASRLSMPSPERRMTISSTVSGQPQLYESSAPWLVSKVTPINCRRDPRQALPAASSIVRPPKQWTVA